MQTTQSINYVAYVEWLAGKASNAYTQFGEDGLIAAVFEKIGTTNRHCFEIGASDGEWYSNTLKLRNAGWFAALIESNPTSFKALNEKYGSVADCREGICTSLDLFLATTMIGKAPDLGVIDIDGQDFYLWQDMVEYRPRVMLVEIHPQPNEPPPVRGCQGQAGLDAVKSLGADKGYSLVASTYCNALFVETSLL